MQKYIKTISRIIVDAEIFPSDLVFWDIREDIFSDIIIKLLRLENKLEVLSVYFLFLLYDWIDYYKV